MITNPNPNNFYSKEEMEYRQNYIPRKKQQLIDRIDVLKKYLSDETPFPESEISIDNIVDISTDIEEIINRWEY